MREVVVRMPDMRCNMAYPAGLRGVLTCPVTKKKCCGQAEIHCPIVCLLPENHGDLMDKDAFLRTVRPASKDDDAKACTFTTVKRLIVDHIRAQKTIVPATETEATPCP